MKKIIALALAAAISVPSAVLAKEAESASVPETFFANERNEEPLYEKGNFSNSFTEVEHRNNSRAWREGMVGGNGETGFVTSGSPYTDTIIYQHMYFIIRHRSRELFRIILRSNSRKLVKTYSI